MTRGIPTRRGPVVSVVLLLTGALLFSVGASLACEAAPSATVAPSSLTVAEGRPTGPADDAKDLSPGARGAEETVALGEAPGREGPVPTEPVPAGAAGAESSAEADSAGDDSSAAQDLGAADRGEAGEAAGEVEGGADGPAPALRYWQRGDEDSGRSGSAREAAAFANKEVEVKELFAAAGVRFPPTQVLFRVFKEESELEVWATDDRREPLRRIATYRICAASGGPGPKTRSGDHQVPEGFYEIDFFKPRSDYYLALHVNYPNRRDRAQRSTGSAIMIHGRCASIGCLAMSDDRIQELWVIGRSLRSGRVQVHIFPQRAMDVLVETTKRDGLKGFWRSLAEGKRRFDADPRLPKKISFNADGDYVFD